MKNITLISNPTNGSYSEAVLHVHADLGKIGNPTLFEAPKLDIESVFNGKFEGSQLSNILAESDLIVFENSILNLELAVLLSTLLNCEIFTNVVELNEDQVICQIYSGKAKSSFKLNSNEKNILVLSKAYRSKESINESLASHGKLDLVSSGNKGKLLKVDQNQSGISLVDAKFVVGAGRGMKDMNNWGIIEQLAQKLGAGLACSKPVSDMNWRPHHEHVGQTGIKIAPKLYIAIGISGAIQHLAGVNGSETIVVINSDPEAPFVKNADYAIIGDLFQVVPQLLNNIN